MTNMAWPKVSRTFPRRGSPPRLKFVPRPSEEGGGKKRYARKSTWPGYPETGRKECGYAARRLHRCIGQREELDEDRGTRCTVTISRRIDGQPLRIKRFTRVETNGGCVCVERIIIFGLRTICVALFEIDPRTQLGERKDPTSRGTCARISVVAGVRYAFLPR